MFVCLLCSTGKITNNIYTNVVLFDRVGLYNVVFSTCQKKQFVVLFFMLFLFLRIEFIFVFN